MREVLPPESPGSTQPPRTRLRFLVYGLVGLVLLVLFGPIFFGPIELMLTIPLGWISFLKRTLPNLHWNWDLIGMALVCITLILAGTHWFANWLARTILLSRPALAHWRWPWKWTWCGVALLTVAFLVGMSVGGIVHQAGWIAASPEPLMERKGFPSERMNMYQLDGDLHFAMAAGNGDLQFIRREFRSRDNGRGNLLESFHVLLIAAPDGTCEGAIFFPRNAKSRERYGGWYQHDDDSGPESSKRILELIQEHNARLVSL